MRMTLRIGTAGRFRWIYVALVSGLRCVREANLIASSVHTSQRRGAALSSCCEERRNDIRKNQLCNNTSLYSGLAICTADIKHDQGIDRKKGKHSWLRKEEAERNLLVSYRS
ncbi:hypothetical protein Dsin_011817 [Dipteronia sinensis]|uniref:Uncharacterized protein n=1 Tax=Dipteronia sinensis TaxID=43782 RepID=A0AAE0AGY9_9ROSI|nr:hypothetical protein Dsin_011817 [Dipteronia sinensis]